MNIMDHEQAVKMQAPERYLLDELSQDERDDFEEHFFTCANCADEVTAAFAFKDNAKAVFESERQAAAAAPVAATLVTPAQARSRWAWLDRLFPAPSPRSSMGAWGVAVPAAAMILMGVAVYQGVFVIPGLRRELSEAEAPRVLQTIVARAATRSNDRVVSVDRNARFVQLVMDINARPSVSSYLFEVKDSSGAVVFAVTAPVAGGSVNILAPTSDLKTGRYVVAVRPSSGSESQEQAQEYAFSIERQP